MGKIVISENVTLDGVIEDPTGAEGLSVGGWFWETDRGQDGENSRSTRRWAPRPCCWVGGATSSSPPRGHPGVESWRTR